MDTTELRAELKRRTDSELIAPLYLYALGLLNRAEADDASNDDEGQGPYYMAGRWHVYNIEVQELAKALGLEAV